MKIKLKHTELAALMQQHHYSAFRLQLTIGWFSASQLRRLLLVSLQICYQIRDLTFDCQKVLIPWNISKSTNKLKEV